CTPETCSSSRPPSGRSRVQAWTAQALARRASGSRRRRREQSSQQGTRIGSRELPATGWGMAEHQPRGQRDFDSSTWATPTFVVQGFRLLTLRVYQRKTASKTGQRRFGAGFQPGLGWSNTFQRAGFKLQGAGFGDIPWQVRDRVRQRPRRQTRKAARRPAKKTARRLAR